MELNDTIYFDQFEAVPDDIFRKCWALNTCDSCLDPPRSYPSISCAWCPYSNACIPASSILSPISNPAICPYDSERWELRARTLGCNMSTRNLLSIFTTVVATLLVVGLFAGLVALWKRRQRRRYEWRLFRDEENDGVWEWLGLENPFREWGVEGWGGWTRGWLLWRREEPQRIPGAWEDDDLVEGERRPLLR